MPYSLRLIEDTLAPGARYKPALGSAAGVLYLAGGEMRVEHDDTAAPLEHGRAQIASRSGTVAGPGGARILRFELVRQPPPAAGGRG